MDGEGTGVVMKVPLDRGAGLQPPFCAAGREIVRKLAGIGHRLEHLVHRLRDPGRNSEFQLHHHSPLESASIMLYIYNMSIHDDYDRVFKALAHAVRRQILDDLKDQPVTTGTLCPHFPDIDRCTVMQHVK